MLGNYRMPAQLVAYRVAFSCTELVVRISSYVCGRVSCKNRRFELTCHLHLHGREIHKRRKSASVENLAEVGDWVKDNPSLKRSL
jgi:hypothetical protein